MFVKAPRTPTVDPPKRGTIARAEFDIQLLTAAIKAVHRDLRLLATVVVAAVAADWLGVDASALLSALGR